MCIEFRDLNQTFLKDIHPLPSMAQILSKISSLEIFSFLDGFSGYKKVLVKQTNRYKNTFITKWGTYAYSKMSFGLINASTTFQKVMEMDFKNMIEFFCVGLP